MVLLTFDSKYIIKSSVAVTTDSSALVDDTEAIQTFVSAEKTVFVFYNVHSNPNVDLDDSKIIALNIDGVDVAHSGNTRSSSRMANRPPNGVTTFWIGTLAAGSHTIKGRFSSSATEFNTTINERVMLIYILDGDEFYYIDDPTSATTDSTVLVDDPVSEFNFTPSGEAIALILYNTYSAYNAPEGTRGKMIDINIDGFDYAQAEKAPSESTLENNVFTVYAASISASPTAIKGRFARIPSADALCNISRRQFGVLLFDEPLTIWDCVENDVQVSTNHNYLVDDVATTIEQVLSDERELLVIAMGTKRNLTASNFWGDTYGLNVDGVDVIRSKTGAGNGLWSGINNFPNSASTGWAATVGSGAHTVQGRFSTNHPTDGAETSIIDSRRVIALWISKPPPLKTLTVYVKDDADAPISTHVIVNGNDGDTDSDGMVQFSLTTGVTVTATASKTAWGGYEGLESEEVTMDADKTITLRLAASSIKKLPIDITGPGDIIWL